MRIVISVVAVVGVLAAVVFAYQAPRTGAALRSAVASVMPARHVEVPMGTPVVVRLDRALSSRDAREGDRFAATIAEPVVLEGRAVIPAGAKVSGRVAVSEPAGRISGHGRLQLEYERLTIASDAYALDARSVVYESTSKAKRSAGLIGGGAVVGGLIGGMTGRSAGDAAKGIVVGGAAGSAASLTGGRPEVRLEPTRRLRFRLDRDLRVRVRPIEAVS